jgi:hypothetical protein
MLAGRSLIKAAGRYETKIPTDKKRKMSIMENKTRSEEKGQALRFVKVFGLVMAGFMLTGSVPLYAEGSAAPRIEDYATIEAYSEDVPVYAFGFTYVYGVSPDFLPGTVLQTGNSNPRIKIQPKKSWEIKENKMGVDPSSVPRSAANDLQPFLSIHLIDGDIETCWSSHPQVQADEEEVWIRIDLAKEELITQCLWSLMQKDRRTIMKRIHCLGKLFRNRLESK